MLWDVEDDAPKEIEDVSGNNFLTGIRVGAGRDLTDNRLFPQRVIISIFPMNRLPASLISEFSAEYTGDITLFMRIWPSERPYWLPNF